MSEMLLRLRSVAEAEIMDLKGTVLDERRISFTGQRRIGFIPFWIPVFPGRKKYYGMKRIPNLSKRFFLFQSTEAEPPAASSKVLSRPPREKTRSIRSSPHSFGVFSPAV